ncbi:butyrate kinase [Desulfitibacter alkalitolerans]|uniref:butyrate kinase n=1 Tax=Desulfitibacter alkalitolerans TaxID=264641 RepID=UPI0005537673|nr:butyrate kinase [Desulfitibacter alkalitolerans]
MINDYDELILVINPGSTSTKLAIFSGEKMIFEETSSHEISELQRFNSINEQLDYRKDAVNRFLEKTQVNPNLLNCIVARGGVLKPISGGTYLVDEKMCSELRNAEKEHASNLGALIAKSIADENNIYSFIVDPIVVDEMNPIAKVSGLYGIERRSIFHALNQKAVARKVASEIGMKYEKCSLIVAHMGGGISIGAHYNGQVIDVNNALDGDGPFSPERAGSLPTCSLVELCFNSGLTEKEVIGLTVGKGGLVSYLRTNNLKLVQEMINEGDTYAQLIFEAMAYQVAKEIGSCAVVLNGEIDAIALTGGLAHSELFIENIMKRISFIAPVMVYPGEFEMEALALGALRVLRREEQYKYYK